MGTAIWEMLLLRSVAWFLVWCQLQVPVGPDRLSQASSFPFTATMTLSLQPCTASRSPSSFIPQASAQSTNSSASRSILKTLQNGPNLHAPLELRRTSCSTTQFGPTRPPVRQSVLPPLPRLLPTTAVAVSMPNWNGSDR